MARMERERESTKLRLTFRRIFLEILLYNCKSFTKFPGWGEFEGR